MNNEGRKQEVIERLCALCEEVGDLFNYKYPVDCFCRKDPPSGFTYQFSEKILEFIEKAIREKIKKGE